MILRYKRKWDFGGGAQRATVVSPTENAKPTLFLDWEPSVKQKIGLENKLMISWEWEW